MLSKGEHDARTYNKESCLWDMRSRPLLYPGVGRPNLEYVFQFGARRQVTIMESPEQQRAIRDLESTDLGETLVKDDSCGCSCLGQEGGWEDSHGPSQCYFECYEIACVIAQIFWWSLTPSSWMHLVTSGLHINTVCPVIINGGMAFTAIGSNHLNYFVNSNEWNYVGNPMELCLEVWGEWGFLPFFYRCYVFQQQKLFSIF